MERKLVKGGIYGFVIGLLISIIIFQDKETNHIGSVIETTYEPMRIYLLKLIRFASITSIVAMIGVWLKEYIVNTDHGISSKSFVTGFVKAFLFIFGVTILAIIFMNWQ